MKRRTLISGIALGLLGSPIALGAQPAGKVSRVGFLGNSTAALEANLVGPFREGLRDLGYVEGRNILIEYRWAEGKYERFPALVTELAALKEGKRLELLREVDFEAKQRLPGVYAYRELVEAGGLMSFGPSYAGMHRRAAYYVDKILKGSKPADLSVEQPTRFEQMINLKTAKALGLKIPPSLLSRADEVVQ